MNQKYLWYIGITMLLFIMLAAGRIYDIDGFAIFIFLIMIIIFIVAFRFRLSKGNISKYPIGDYTLVWADEVPQEKPLDINKIRIWKRISITCMAILILLTAPIILWNLIPQVLPKIDDVIRNNVYFFAWALSFLGLIISSIFFIIMNLSYKVQQIGEQLKVYKEGIRHLNYFIPWQEMKSMNYPGTFRLSKNLSRSISNYYTGSSTTLKIVDKTGKTYLVELYGLEKFEEIMAKLGKKSLLA